MSKLTELHKTDDGPRYLIPLFWQRGVRGATEVGGDEGNAVGVAGRRKRIIPPVRREERSGGM